MPFVPTENQIKSLCNLLKQLQRENIEVRLIRFVNWAQSNDILNCQIEVICTENTDKYIILHNGKIIGY